MAQVLRVPPRSSTEVALEFIAGSCTLGADPRGPKRGSDRVRLAAAQQISSMWR
jgi:hypothetical protein